MSGSGPAQHWLSRYVHLPPSEWPLWARGCHARSTSSVTGAAAISAHAAAAGVSLPRGNANRSVASRLQLDSVFSRLSSRFATALSAALDALREDADLPRDSAAPHALEPGGHRRGPSRPPGPFRPGQPGHVCGVRCHPRRRRARPSPVWHRLCRLRRRESAQRPLDSPAHLLPRPRRLGRPHHQLLQEGFLVPGPRRPGLPQNHSVHELALRYTRPFPAPCTPGDPCPHLVRGRHPTALGGPPARVA